MWFHDELVPTVHTVRADRPLHPGGRAAGHGRRRSQGRARWSGTWPSWACDGTDVVLIGDSIDDADAALAVGGRAVLYSGGFTDPARLRASGHPVADTLTGAVALARPGEVSSRR